MDDVEVLVIGGGPTGLAAAMFLAWYDVPVLLVERHQDTSAHPKARAINPRTMELFRAAGIEDRVRAARSPISGNTDLVHVHTLAGEERVRMPSASPEDIRKISPTQWTLIDQNQLEPVLRRRAVEAGADVRFHHRVDAVEEAGDGVVATVTDLATGAVRRVRARYVIAADGSRSPVRGMLGIPHHGTGTMTSLVSVFFTADLRDALRGRKVIAAYVNNERMRGTLIPIDNEKRWVLNISFFPERGQSAEDFDEQRCTELVRAAVGDEDLQVEIESNDLAPWDIAARVADRFSLGRVFVAGDAAHVMPPTGAFGASTGIQDAFNLAWKLAHVLSGAAGPDLLRSYHDERAPVAEETVRQAMLRFAVREGKELADVEGALVSEAVMTYGYRYPAGAFVPGDGFDAAVLEDPLRPSAQPGARAPHAVVRSAAGETSTVDLFGRRFVLFGYETDVAGARDEAARVGVELDALRVGADLEDPHGEFAGKYQVRAGDAVLVRPDGFVAWRGVFSAAAVGSALRQVLARD
ncbi:putative polyketide hydroxylase [Lentzea albidocapillata subsp. violacea]|uniref:Putative polyketide hydroxylase n=1 Tax=Lentzea albidocapillata subsp. violacea TaxID=128104 RepID=A0A1G9LTK4_9PSEU|nr:FAD-dependent monooxygenase [Lentzea albidocapillata]SDL65340.1 putative polyketide hydroxylase [Lentzea albidocapillata subsp. violacea]